ncbi:MAG: hypothetical protein EP343_23085 [Deltaproteobacteria bacterium]|nr:MAG: hypothetical protein EP343_23085 [Deltaproteobacteria bacterium]
MTAVTLARYACGLFFITGLLTGVWKYIHIMRSEEAKAPVYVDIAHRAGLMYSFACLVLAYFAALSQWSEGWNLLGVGLAVGFFAAAEMTYIIHGVLKDTDNQLRRPIQLGSGKLPTFLVHLFMFGLIAGELGGFLIVFIGAMK